jgi:O-antigen/teichoic acid export membrane protein
MARAIGALGTPIFTRLLTPEEYGLYPLYVTWLGVFTVFVTLELTGAVMYRGLQRYGEDSDRFVGEALGLILTLSGFFGLIYVVFSRFINGLTGLDSPITVLMLLEILASAIISLYTAKARFEYRYKTVALFNVLSAVMMPTVSVLLILAVGVRAEARILGASLSLTVIALPILVVIARRSQRLYSFDTWRYLLGRGLPLLPHYFAMTMILKVGEIAISRHYGTAELGKFSVALSVGMALTVVTGGIQSALSPWIIRRMRCRELARIRELTLLLTKLVALACLGLLAVAPEAIALFSAPSYRSVLPAVYPLALCVIPTFLSSTLMSGGIYFERSGLSSLPSVTAAILSAALSLFVLPLVDYRYLSVFVLISYTLLAVMNTVIFTRLAHEPPLFISKTALVFLATIGYAALLFATRDMLFARLLLALPLVPLLFRVAGEAWESVKEK